MKKGGIAKTQTLQLPGSGGSDPGRLTPGAGAGAYGKKWKEKLKVNLAKDQVVDNHIQHNKKNYNN